MKKIFHITNTFEKSNLQEDGSITIKGLASTNALDRTGDIIDHNAWKEGGYSLYIFHSSLGEVCLFQTDSHTSLQNDPK